jgi:5-methylcytosine-specific restriction endonuclease McrA
MPSRYLKQKAINRLPKDTKAKYLSMTAQSLSPEETRLEQMYEDLILAKAVLSEYDKVRDGTVPRDKKIPPKFESPDGESPLRDEFPYLTKDIQIKLLEAVLTTREADEALFLWDTQDQKKQQITESMSRRWLRIVNDSAQIKIRAIQKAWPEIKSRVIKKEHSAKLAGYEGKSREKGSAIISKIKKSAHASYDCPYCENKLISDNGHVDHINPISNGGLSVERNMVLVCADCNLRKGSLSLRRFSKKYGLDFNEICDTLEQMGKWI